MNRVRIVAIGAVALGATVVAGTKFQEQQGYAALDEPARAAVQPLAEALPDASAPIDANAPSLLASAPAQEMSREAAPTGAQIFGNGAVSLASAEPPKPGEAVEDAPVVQLAGAGSSVDMTQPAASPTLSSASVLPGVVTEQPLAGATGPETNPSLLQSLASAQADAVEPLAEPAQPLNAELEAELNACSVWLVVTPAESAMLDMSIYAPCDNGGEIEVSHAGMSFNTRIGADGQLMSQIPALTQEAMITVTFADGRVQSDSTFVDDLQQHDRVVMQWAAPAEFVLHAYEFGAEYGDAGHVYAANSREPSASDRGFMTVLGDASLENGQRAQVYSYPVGESVHSTAIRVEVEVPITSAVCGQAVDAMAMNMHLGEDMRQHEINLVMPDCDGAGGFVILQDIMPNQAVAMN